MTATVPPLEANLPSLPAPWRRPVDTGGPHTIAVTHVTDPLCPWAYSFEPVLRTIEARYGDQLEFRTVVIGPVSTVEESLARGSSAEGRALTALRFRRFGMPITPHVQALSDSRGRQVRAAYEADTLEARTPHPAASAVRRTANSDGMERHTAPTLLFTAEDGESVVVPGFQPFEAYDAALMNLEPSLVRLPPPEPGELLESYPGGLTSQEVARVLADTTAPVDRQGTEHALTRLAATGRARRVAVGDDALWRAP